MSTGVAIPCFARQIHLNSSAASLSSTSTVLTKLQKDAAFGGYRLRPEVTPKMPWKAETPLRVQGNDVSQGGVPCVVCAPYISDKRTTLHSEPPLAVVG